ncbi:MAG TPA: two-component regulator propeller domain-containing protein, partial [Chitinophagaceae bacterium]
MKRNFDPSVILLSLIINIINQSAFAQAPPLQFQHLTFDQGLSHNRVTAFTQDKYGLIWIGTNDGLNRFDGYKVDIYRNERGDKNSLPENSVRCLFTDSHGVVWIGTTNGLAYYDYRSNSFQSFFSNSKDENSLPFNNISAINEDANGILWIGTNSGLCSFDIKNKRFKRFLHDGHSNSISGNVIRDIEFAPDGTMWISTNNGLNRLELSTMKFNSFFNDPNDSTTLSGNTLTKMAIDKNENLWVCVNETTFLECFNTKTHRVSHFKTFTEKQSHISNNSPRDIFVDRGGRLWVGTGQGGLYLYSPGKNIFYQYKADLLDPNKLHSNSIIEMYQDNSGMIWLGTHSYAERFNPDESKFIFHQPKFPATQNFVNPLVQVVAEDSSHNIWIGTDNGISILDRKTYSYTSYQWDPKDPHSISSNGVQAFCKDKWGNMWVGTMKGLNLYDPIEKRFRKFYSKKDTSFAMSFIQSIVSGKNGDLIIGGQAGLSIIYNFENDSVHTLLKDAVRIIYEDRSGVLWIGTEASGLIKYDRLTKEKERFKNLPEDSTSLASNQVFSITQDRRGEIWIGTSSGLCRFNGSTRKFTTFSEKNGLPNDRVTQLLVDDKDCIWMCTKKGISMLNESRVRFTNYSTGDGLQGSQFPASPAFKSRDGYFYYAGQNDFKMFHPD